MINAFPGGMHEGGHGMAVDDGDQSAGIVIGLGMHVPIDPHGHIRIDELVGHDFVSFGGSAWIVVRGIERDAFPSLGNTVCICLELGVVIPRDRFQFVIPTGNGGVCLDCW